MLEKCVAVGRTGSSKRVVRHSDLNISADDLPVTPGAPMPNRRKLFLRALALFLFPAWGDASVP